jgi:hypothetical protein
MPKEGELKSVPAAVRTGQVAGVVPPLGFVIWMGTMVLREFQTARAVHDAIIAGGFGGTQPVRTSLKPNDPGRQHGQSKKNPPGSIHNHRSRSSTAGGSRKAWRTAGMAAPNAANATNGTDKASFPGSIWYKKVHPKDW